MTSLHSSSFAHESVTLHAHTINTLRLIYFHDLRSHFLCSWFASRRIATVVARFGSHLQSLIYPSIEILNMYYLKMRPALSLPDRNDTVGRWLVPLPTAFIKTNIVSTSLQVTNRTNQVTTCFWEGARHTRVFRRVRVASLGVLFKTYSCDCLKWFVSIPGYMLCGQQRTVNIACSG